MDIENFVHHAASPGPVFFERGVLDALCALDRVTPLNEGELRMWLSKYQYFPKVFVLPPWKAIYVNDAVRARRRSRPSNSVVPLEMKS
jgi:predicted ATPase